MLWVVLAILSVMMGLYPSLFFMGEKRVGILKLKPAELFLNPFWQTSFYIHITLGGLALLTGWIQFSPKIRSRYTAFHRTVGKIYVIAVLLSALAGFFIAFYASGGAAAALGFMSLGITWFYTTLKAYISIRKGHIIQHRNMMIYSYASCFAAVTLRLWMPVLVALTGNFQTAYVIVAWWCWLPNLAIAHLLARKE